MELGTLIKDTLYLVLQHHIFSNTCGFTLSQTVLKWQDYYGAFALEKLYSGFSTFTFNLLHFLLSLSGACNWSTFPQDIQKVQLDGGEAITCNMPKKYITKYFSDSCDHYIFFVSPSYHQTIVEPVISI